MEDHTSHPQRRQWDKVDPSDNHNLSLHFSLLEMHMKNLEDEVKDTKNLVRDNRRVFMDTLNEDKKELNERINKIDGRLWAILFMTLGTMVTAIISKFI